MLQHEESCGLLCTITSEIHWKYTCSNTNNANVNENVVRGLLYNALWTAVFL